MNFVSGLIQTKSPTEVTFRPIIQMRNVEYWISASRYIINEEYTSTDFLRK